MTEKQDNLRGAQGQGGPPPGAADLEREGARFLAAVQRAKDAQAAQTTGLRLAQPRAIAVRPGRSWRLAGAWVLFTGAALCALLLLRPAGRVQAGPQAGLSGVVTNSLTNRAQQGVVFRRIEGARSGRVVCVSNAVGAYALSPPETARGEVYEYSYDGEALGRLQVGPGRRQLCGSQPLTVAILPEKLIQRRPVVLQPGETREEVLPGVSLSLAADATGAWTGSLERTSDWPACFSYGRLLDGIYRIDGPAADLTVSVRLDRGVLDCLEGAPEEVELITHSAEYADPDSPLCGQSGRFAGNDPSFHRGWYISDQPLGALPPGPGLSLTSGPDGNHAAWRPRSGAPYALILRQREQGPATAAWLSVLDPGTGKRATTPIVGVIRPFERDNSLYYINYFNHLGERVDLGSYPDIYSPYKLFADVAAVEKRAEGLPVADAFLDLEEHRRMPGTYVVTVADFTLSAPYDYAPIQADFSQAPPDLELEITPHGLGQLVHCRVRGPLPELARPIEWDLRQDGVTEGFGAEFDFPTPSPGSYRIWAIVWPRQGIPVVLRDAVNIAPDKVIGYGPAQAVDSPVIAGLDAPPRAEAVIRAMSVNSVPHPADLAFLTGQTAGPMLYVELPPDFRGAAVQELRLFVHASPRGGNNATCAISPQLQLVSGVDRGLQYPFSSACDRTSDNPEPPEYLPSNWVGHAASRSYECRSALKQHAADRLNGARQYYLDFHHFLKGRSTHKVFEDSAKIVLGFDPSNPPPEEELVALLERFRASRYYCQHFVTEEEQEVRSVVDCHGAALPPAACGFLVSMVVETENILNAAQWDLYSGPAHQARCELVTTDGRTLVRYFDYSGLQP